MLGVEGNEYALYLADAREVTETGLGDPIGRELVIALPEGDWKVAFINPDTGPLDTVPPHEKLSPCASTAEKS